MNHIIAEKYEKQIEQLKRERDAEIMKYTLKNSKQNGDLTLICKDGQVKVFSEVLHEFSDYYKNQFVFQQIDNPSTLNLSEFRVEIIECVVQSLYSKTYDKEKLDDWKNIIEFFCAADFLLLSNNAHNIFKSIALSIKSDFVWKRSFNNYYKLFPYTDFIVSTENEYIKFMIRCFILEYKDIINREIMSHEKYKNCGCNSRKTELCTYAKTPIKLQKLCFNIMLGKISSSSSSTEDSSTSDDNSSDYY